MMIIKNELLGINYNKLAVRLINNDKLIYCEPASQKQLSSRLVFQME